MPPAVTLTQEQISTLVEFMERHGDLSINPKELRNKLLWVELIGILNHIGGPRKNLELWKKTWTDLKYRTKQKALKSVQGTASPCDCNTTVLSELEERICVILKNNHSQSEDSNDDNQKTEDPQDCEIPSETADPVFIEIMDHAVNLSPVLKTEKSPSPSPPSTPFGDLRRKRKRFDSHEDKSQSFNNATMKRIVSNATNIETENQTIQNRQLIELKRLELETLRENNLHEREKVRAEIEREKNNETIKMQQEFVAFLQDIKPALIKFLNK